MCARYSLTSPPETVRACLGAVNRPNFPARYNIAPTQPVLILRPDAGGGRALALVRWGLIPTWVEDPRRFTTLINARAETAADKPAFRAAMRHRRCLVPADGYYDWIGERGRKRPFLVRRRDGGLLAFAGLWEAWQGPDGEEMESAAILTTGANAALRPLHERMPAILAPDRFAEWLDTGRVNAQSAAGLLAPAPDDWLEAVEVGPRINDPRVDEPGVQQPLQGELF